MQPSANPPLGFGVGQSNRWLTPAITTFILCLGLGAIVVTWRALGSAQAERARAQTAALGRGAALELQFSRASAAAEALGALARQSGGAIPNFQKTAADLQAALPGLASLEIAPGGIVSDIVPRPGNQPAIGLNLLTHPAYREGAAAALQGRTSTVAAPVALYGGEPGFTVRVPIFQKSGATDRFWGFVAVSMRLSEALSRAGLTELSRQGYDYALFVPASATAKGATLARHGLESLRDAVQQPVRVQNLEMRLALRRSGGWVSTARVLLESAAVLLAAALVFGLVESLGSRRRSSETLTQAQRQLAIETAERERAQADLAKAKEGVQGELAQAQTVLQQALAEVANQAEALRAATEAQQAAEAARQQAQLAARETEARLRRAEQSAEAALAATRADLADARAKLSAAEQKTRQAEEAITASRQAEKAAVGALETHQAKTQTTLAGLQARLEFQKTEAEKAAQAAAARLEEVETLNRELQAKLAELEQAQAQRIELPTPMPPMGPDPEIPEPGVDLAPAPEPLAAATAVEPEPAGPIEAAPDTTTPPAKRKRARRKDQNQIDLFEVAEAAAPDPTPFDVAPDEPDEEAVSARFGRSGAEVQVSAEEASPEPDFEEEVEPDEDRPAATRRPAGPVDVAELRRAVNEILPLLADKDPGAKDCFKANRSFFRPAFPPAGFEEFEQCVRSGTFDAALDRLIKVARKHGIHV